MEPILEAEEGPKLVTSLFDEQVLDYRQRELAAAKLRVHVPMTSCHLFVPGFCTRNPRLTQWDWLGTSQPLS